MPRVLASYPLVIANAEPRGERLLFRNIAGAHLGNSTLTGCSYVSQGTKTKEGRAPGAVSIR